MNRGGEQEANIPDLQIEPPLIDEPWVFTKDALISFQQWGEKLIKRQVADPKLKERYLALWSQCQPNSAGLSDDRINNINYDFGQLDCLVGEINHALTMEITEDKRETDLPNETGGDDQETNTPQKSNEVEQVLRIYELILGVKIDWTRLHANRKTEIVDIASRHAYSLSKILDLTRSLVATIEDFYSRVNLGELKEELLEGIIFLDLVEA